MKNLIVILFITSLSLSVTVSQNLKESDVPTAVKEKFSSLYANTTNVKWEMEHGNYEAEFKENNIETSVIFDKDAKHIQTEIEIAVSSLPAKIHDYASGKLPGKKIKEATKITDSGGKISYEAEIGGHDYIFDEDGNFIRDETDSDDTEDDDK